MSQKCRASAWRGLLCLQQRRKFGEGPRANRRVFMRDPALNIGRRRALENHGRTTPCLENSVAQEMSADREIGRKTHPGMWRSVASRNRARGHESLPPSLNTPESGVAVVGIRTFSAIEDDVWKADVSQRTSHFMEPTQRAPRSAFNHHSRIVRPRSPQVL